MTKLLAYLVYVLTLFFIILVGAKLDATYGQLGIICTIPIFAAIGFYHSQIIDWLIGNGQ